MKVAQNDETNPNMQSICPPHIPNIANAQLSPSGSSVRKRKTPGILSRMFPPFAGITSYRVRAHLTPLFALSCICLHCIHCFFPLFSPVDYETDAAAGAPFDYAVDNPSFLPEQPGKPPLDHQISPVLPYTACTRIV